MALRQLFATRLLLTNAGRFFAVAVPVFLALLWLKVIIAGTPGAFDLQGLAETVLFHAILWLIPVAITLIAVHLVISLVGVTRPMVGRPLVFVASLILPAMLTRGYALFVVQWLLVPLLAGLAAFSIVYQLPRATEDE